MNTKILPLLVLSLSSLFSLPLFAGDSAAGQSKAGVCFGCHGSEGNSTNPLYPNLAGQQTAYLINQLTAFRENKRANPIMSGMAKNLSDTDIEDLAAYFSGKTTKSAGGDPALAKLGATKANQCFGCHAGKAQGRGQFPKLAGQHPAYLAKQLSNFKAGERKNPGMQAIAANLSDTDIAEITAFLGTL